jgi:hypothetical protein
MPSVAPGISTTSRAGVGCHVQPPAPSDCNVITLFVPGSNCHCSIGTRTMRRGRPPSVSAARSVICHSDQP